MILHCVYWFWSIKLLFFSQGKSKLLTSFLHKTQFFLIVQLQYYKIVDGNVDLTPIFDLMKFKT